MKQLDMRALVCTLLVFFLANNVLAHGVGLTLESVTPEGYMAYLDVDALVPRQNEPTRLDFEIRDKGGNPMEFTDVWVRIEKEQSTIFAGPIARARLGTTGLTISLPFSGEHTVFVRFQNGETALTEVEFKLSVEKETDEGVQSKAVSTAVAGVGGVLVGSFGTLFWRRRRKTEEEIA